MSILTKLIDKITGPLPRRAQLILKKYGNIPITKIELKRTPIEKAIGWLMNILSKGSFEENRKQYFYDNYFHLQIVCYLQTGEQIVMEKNQNINIDVYKGDAKNTETMPVSNYSSNNLTMNDLMNNAVQKVSYDRLYRYNPYTANCQMWVGDILQSSNLDTPELRKWYLQNIATLVQKMPSTSKFISELSTDIGGYMDKMLQWLRLYKEGGKVEPAKMKLTKEMKNFIDPYAGVKYKKGDIIRRTRDYSDIKNPTMVKVNKPSKREKGNNDLIPALLVKDEMVIPRKHVKKVSDFLKSQNIKLSGMK